MRERRHYSKAPIKEAVIDLRVTTSKGITVEEIQAVHRLIADDYPTKEPVYHSTGEVSFDVERPEVARTGAGHAHTGYRFTDNAKQRVLQCRLTGFTFSTLAPYDRWETFRDEAKRLWDIYSSKTRIEHITRVALRYINRMEFENVGRVELSDYLRVYPETPSDWPMPDMNGFFMQVYMVQDDLSCMLILNESGGVEKPGTIFLQLDIDLFRSENTLWTLENQDAVWDFLEQLHDRKNDIFEGSITDKTREMIK